MKNFKQLKKNFKDQNKLPKSPKLSWSCAAFCLLVVPPASWVRSPRLQSARRSLWGVCGGSSGSIWWKEMEGHFFDTICHLPTELWTLIQDKNNFWDLMAVHFWPTTASIFGPEWMKLPGVHRYIAMWWIHLGHQRHGLSDFSWESLPGFVEVDLILFGLTKGLSGITVFLIFPVMHCSEHQSLHL